jgi:hypothetical protein
MTVPTSRTSISASKRSSCAFSTSLMARAVISATYASPPCGAVDRLARTASSWEERLPSSTRPPTLMMTPPTIEASTRSRSETGRPSEATSLSVSTRAGVVERHGGRDLGHDDAPLGLGDLAEDASDLVEHAGMTSLHRQRDDRDDLGCHLPYRRSRAGSRASWRRTSGVDKRGPQVDVTPDGLGDRADTLIGPSTASAAEARSKRTRA